MEEEVDVSCIRVGKLTESRFRLSSDISEIEKDTDTNIVPSGMVAKVLIIIILKRIIRILIIMIINKIIQ